MKICFGSALALALLPCAAPLLAEDGSADEIVALGQRPDAHGPAGTMADHVHKSGDLMIGLSWMHEESRGTNRSGSAELANSAVVAAGFTARTQAMVMDMAMLHVMWAPSDRVTLTLMPSWQHMRMTMVGIAPAAGHGDHVLGVGDTMAHSISGIGDTQVGALVALSRRPAFSVHAGLNVSIPTGSVTRKDEHGNFVHYGMQPGSGTWDLVPSLTLRGTSSALSWGAQASYVWRAEARNRTGFRFGDRFTASTWLSKPVGSRLSLSARLGWTSEGPVEGHYNSGHNHAAPPDRQANYGGSGSTPVWAPSLLGGRADKLGLEASVPLWQKLNGIQAPGVSRPTSPSAGLFELSACAGGAANRFAPPAACAYRPRACPLSDPGAISRAASAARSWSAPCPSAAMRRSRSRP